MRRRSKAPASDLASGQDQGRGSTEDSTRDWSALRDRLIGMGEDSMRKSYYPELQQRLRDLDAMNRKLESMVQDRTRELLDKNKELEQANARLLQLDKLKNAFVSTVSHEIRTPLTSVLGFSQLVSKDFAKIFAPLAQGDERLESRAKRLQGNIEVIKLEGQRLTRLINDFLDLSKIESGRMVWRDSDVPVTDLVDTAMRIAEGQLRLKPEVRLDLRMEDGLPALRVDPDRMVQVLVNLLNNAIKFTDSGHVTLEVSSTDQGDVEFKVSDTGTGIPSEELPKVFDMFHQAEHSLNEHSPMPGTGLGLTICREIVTHYGGDIWAESTLGQGSSFIFRLPVPLPAQGE